MASPSAWLISSLCFSAGGRYSVNGVWIAFVVLAVLLVIAMAALK